MSDDRTGRQEYIHDNRTWKLNGNTEHRYGKFLLTTVSRIKKSKGVVQFPPPPSTVMDRVTDRVRDRVRDRDMGRVRDRVRLRGLAIAAPSYSGP